MGIELMISKYRLQSALTTSSHHYVWVWVGGRKGRRFYPPIVCVDVGGRETIVMVTYLCVLHSFLFQVVEDALEYYTGQSIS